MGDAAELKRQIHTFEVLLSSVKDYLYVFDREGRFVYTNKMLLDLWGLTTEQALGKSMRDLEYAKEVEEKLLQGVQEVINTRQTVKNETRYTSPTGKGAYYETILAPVLGSEGNVLFIAVKPGCAGS